MARGEVMLTGSADDYCVCVRVIARRNGCPTGVGYVLAGIVVTPVVRFIMFL